MPSILDDEMGHRFEKVGTYRGNDVYICRFCLETCKRGDTIYNRCQKAWD